MLKSPAGRAAAAVAALAGALCAGAAGAQAPAMPYANQPFPPGDYSHSQFSNHDRVHMQAELRKLREEAVRQQKADGGQLTPAHREAFNQRLGVLMKQACAVGTGGNC